MLKSATAASEIVPAASKTRPLYWSIRRELWENHSIFIAPLAVAAVAMIAFFFNPTHLARTVRGMEAMDATSQQVMLAMPYSHASYLLTLIMVLVGVFYCMDALYGERRDRSILFWKSLPVSDLTTVLAKASIPLLVLPALTFVLTVALHLIMLMLSIAVPLFRVGSVATYWSRLPLFQLEAVLLYALIVQTLWHAPIYAWLLLVSGWARRAVFLWVLIPPIAIGIFERMAFQTNYFGSMIADRWIGFVTSAFSFIMPSGAHVDPHFIPVTQLTPWDFLGRPGLWIGLLLAAAFLAVAVRLRRYREPI